MLYFNIPLHCQNTPPSNNLNLQILQTRLSHIQLPTQVLWKVWGGWRIQASATSEKNVVEMDLI